MTKQALRLDAIRAADTDLSVPLTFEEFFRLERDHLFGTLCLITGDRDEAEELAQEAFTTVWERWDRVQGMDNPAGYVHRVATNAFRKRYRRQMVLRRVLPHVAEREHEGSAEAPAVLHEALAALTPRQRAALVLTELWGFSAAEAGRALGVRASTIGALKHQGRNTLRERADDDD